jgi:flap endonuclease-1
MGIKGLTALIQEHAPKAIKVHLRVPDTSCSTADALAFGKEHDIKTLFGRKVAIDASMSIYQFLIAVRQRDGEMLQNSEGETTRYVKAHDAVCATLMRRSRG